MKNITKMKNLLSRRVGIYREKPKVNYGYIGNQSTGEVSVPGTKRTIYVTSIDGVVFKVVCKRVEPNFQTKVIFGNDPDDMPGVTQVLSEWNVYGGPGIVQGPEDNGIEGASYIGSDPTNSQWPSPSAPYIEPEQIQISNYYPSGLTVDVFAGVYLTTTGVKQVRIVTTIDHTASVPTTADMCRYSLLVVDASGAFVIRDGAEVTGFDNLVTGDIAAFVAGDNPIYAVALFTGQTELRRDGEVNHFVDLRFMGVSSGSAVTTGPHAPTHISTGTDPIADAVAAGASGLMSGADKTKLDSLSTLRIKTADGATNVTPVDTIVVTNGTLTDDTGGQVTIDTGGGGGGLGLDPIDCTAQVDGTETHFTFTPASTAALALLNGALMKPADVTLDVDGLGVVLGFPPEVGDNLIIIRAADVAASGGHTIQDAGTPMTARANLNFIGMTVEDDAVNAATKVTVIPAHVVQDAGTSQTQRSKLNFIGATVADNSGDDSTDVTIASSVEYPKFQEVFFDDFVAYSGVGFARDINSAYPFHWTMYSATPVDGDKWDVGIIIDAGTYTLKLWTSTGPNMGKVDISIDGASPISTFDGYSGGWVHTYTYTVSTGALSSGYHKLSFTINGKNASSASYCFYGSKLSIIPAAY